MGCGCAGGGKRPATTVLVFVVTDGSQDVGEYPSFHEARVAAAAAGPGWRADSRRRAYDNA